MVLSTDTPVPPEAIELLRAAGRHPRRPGHRARLTLGELGSRLSAGRRCRPSAAPRPRRGSSGRPGYGCSCGPPGMWKILLDSLALTGWVGGQTPSVAGTQIRSPGGSRPPGRWAPCGPGPASWSPAGGAGGRAGSAASAGPGRCSPDPGAWRGTARRCPGADGRLGGRAGPGGAVPATATGPWPRRRRSTPTLGLPSSLPSGTGRLVQAVPEPPTIPRRNERRSSIGSWARKVLAAPPQCESRHARRRTSLVAVVYGSWRSTTCSAGPPAVDGADDGPQRRRHDVRVDPDPPPGGARRRVVVST